MRITKVISQWIFEISDLLTDIKHTVHATRLKYYHDPSLQITEELKSQLRFDGACFEPAAIIAHRLNVSRWEFRVQWVGFEDEDTWEPILQLYADVPTMLKAYLKSVSNASDKAKMIKIITKKYSAFTLD